MVVIRRNEVSQTMQAEIADSDVDFSEANDTAVSRTRASISQGERGKEDKAAGLAAEEFDAVAAADVPSIEDQRVKLAQNLIAKFDHVIKSRGRLAMAAAIKSLQREFSRAYDVIGDDRRESNFLSMVSLIESVTTSPDFAKMDIQLLRQLRSELVRGTQHGPISYDEFQRAHRRVHFGGMESEPLVDDDNDEDE